MNNFNDFINYCLDFYGKGGLYDQGRTKEQIAYATTVYLDACAYYACLLYTSPSPRDPKTSRMPSSA